MIETGIMNEPRVTVDVRDMLCAQALAVVAKHAAALQTGETAAISYSAQDVKRDLRAWAADRGHTATIVTAELLHLTIGPR